MLRTFTVAIVCGLILAMLIAWQSAWPNAHADTSGPNLSGYTWVDSNSPDPATTFEWIDATGGTRLAISDEDDEWETVNLPFTFTFFDTDYSQVAVASNGFLSFDTTDTAGCNLNYNETFTDELGSSIPHDDANCTDDGWGSNPLIAVWFDDLSPLNCGDIYHDSSGTAPDRKFVVEFNNICHYDCASTCDAREAATFEVIFFEGSNTIKLQYLDTYYGENTPNITEENYGGTATTGINLDGNTGLQYSWADPILTDGLAVLFSTSCPADEDCDGVLDGDDLCPSTPPEEAVDANGCSDSQLDDDEDGVSNADDLCPLLAEDFDGFQDADGCPDPDNDLDSICDPGQSSDSCTGSDEGEMVFDPAGTLPAPTIDCRNIPEDFDGFKDSDGCPDPDNDNDGFPDVTDACPGTDDLAGADGMLGSPEDLDHNGIQNGGESPLTTDDSVLTFEDYDGVLDGDGCHDSPGDDFDGDGLTDDDEVFVYGTLPFNPDTDGDTVLDGPDNCKVTANTAQTNTDAALGTLGAAFNGVPIGDALGDACDDDDDDDGYTDVAEAGIGTAGDDNCTNSSGPGPNTDAWPSDMNANDAIAINDVTGLFAQHFGAVQGVDPTGTNPGDYNPRVDLNQSGSIAINDITGPLGADWGKTCS